MPNDSCPQSSEVVYQKDSPSLMPQQTDASFEGSSNWGEQKAYEAYTAKDAVNRAQAMDALNATISPDNQGQMPLTTADKIGLRQASKQLQIAFANDALASRLAAEQAAWNMASDTTVGKGSRLLNMVSGLSSKWLNGRAKRDQWGLVFAGEEGLTAQNNRLVELSNLSEARIEGLLQTFTGWMDEVTKAAHPYARRANMSTQEFMQRVGDYANMQHAIERNDMLIRRWRAEADRIEAQDAAKANQYRRWADTLEAYRDEIDPMDAGGGRIMSGGITDGEARMYSQKILDMLNMTHEEMAPLTQGLRDVYSRIQQERIDNGMVAPTVLESFPDFQFFVPFRTIVDNGSGLATDANIYNPGHFHAIDGTNATVQDAFTTINTFARRAALELGHQDLGRYLVALRDKHRAEGVDSGLRVYDYGLVLNRRMSSDPKLSAWANRVLNSNESGGIVVDISRRADDGSIVWDRKLVTFNPQWKDTTHGTNLTGMELASTFGTVSKNVTGLGRVATGITSRYGQMFTRFNPMFAPINAQRDNFERMFNLVGRAYEREDGSIVQGYRLMGSYVANLGQSINTLGQALRGSLDTSTEMGRYWDEYVRNGLHQQYTRGMNEKRTTLADAIETVQKKQGGDTPQRLQDVIARDSKLKGFRQKLANINDDFLLGKAVQKLDAYNDFFNNIASFNHFVTLRRAGVETSKAAHGALAEMNLYQTGTLVPMLRAMFPFVKPTMQGAAAAARSLGLAPNAKGQFRGNTAGTFAFVGTILAASALSDASRSLMGEDERGRSYFDLIPMGQIQRMLPISIGGGDYVKFNYGFGYAPIAATLAVGYDRVKRGIMSPEDFGVEVASVIARNMSPADFPQFAASQDPFKWLAQFVTPSAFRPLAEAALNKNVFGGDIYTEPDEKKAKAFSGRAGTQPMFKKAAGWIYNKFGLDAAPEQVRHIVDGYSFGPIKLLTEMSKQSELPATGVEKNIRQELGPFWTAVGATMVRGKVANINRTQFMQEQNKLNERIKKENLPITSTSYGSDKEKREEYQRGVLEDAGWNDADIEKYLALERGSAALSKHAKEFRKHLEEDGILDADDTDSLKSAYADYYAQQDEDYLAALIEAGLAE